MTGAAPATEAGALAGPRVVECGDGVAAGVRGKAPRLAEWGLTWSEVHARHPALVMTSIAPFGLSGPHAELEASDLTMWAAGGIAYLNGGGPGSEDMPPLEAFGQQASFQGGVHAAVATMGALFGRRRLGGAGQHVEVSIQECLASILELTYVYWPYMGLVASRLGRACAAS